MNFGNVAKGTWVRIVTLLLVLVNLISTSVFGYVLLPFAEEEVYEGVSIALTIGVSIWTAWRNNSFTKEAQEADKYLDSLREWKK